MRSIAVQSLNAFLLIFLMPAARVNVFSEVQRSKAHSSIFSTGPSIVMDFSEMHLLNPPHSMVFIDEGMTMLVRPVQPEYL